MGRRCTPFDDFSEGLKAMRDLDAEHRRLCEAASPERLASESFVRQHRVVEALHRPSGIRSCFAAVERANIGPSWIMRDLSGTIPGVVRDADLEGMTPAPWPGGASGAPANGPA